VSRVRLRYSNYVACLVVCILVLLACVASGFVSYHWWLTALREQVWSLVPTATAAVIPGSHAGAAPDEASPLSLTLLPTATRAVRYPSFSARPDASPTTTEDMLGGIDLPVRDRLDLARRFAISDKPIPSVVNRVTPSYSVGDQETFCVLESDAARHFDTKATLSYKGRYSYWWVQDGYHVDEAALSASADAFENKIYPTDRSFFGSEWSPGVDNDPRIHIFLGDVPGVSGYFYSANEYSRLINPCSNEKEMFYLNIHAVQPGTPDLNGTLAHEFQHMIHWYHDANEETWVNEGLSDLAMELNGYSPNDGGRSFMQAPDTQLTAWGDQPGEQFAHYGASYLFMSYFLARFGEGIMRQVVASPRNGAAGFDAVLESTGQPYRFDDIFGDWVIANYLNNPNAGQGLWGYRNLDLYPVYVAAEHRDYPVDQHGVVSQYATDYILFEGEGDLTIDFEGATQVKVVPDNPHSGTYQWWSNRGDDSDMMLTRAFDLSGVRQATMDFWVWYDIEGGWDYAFVEASADSGVTWKILPGRYSTTDNPSGNSFGPAWTGVSGGGEAPAWVQEQVDLTPYAGREIQARFELVTDDAVNHEGLMLDDISVPEIGYFDDVESGDGGWVARGFARIDNVLPQRYLVQVIELADSPRVLRMVLDRANHGGLTVKDLGGSVNKAVLVVSGLTPFTTESAPYHYRASLTQPGEASD
jgi:immune inhibitor A